MKANEIERLAFYKIKTVGRTVVYKVIDCSLRNGFGWVAVVVLDGRGRWLANKMLGLSDFLKLVEMRVKPR